METSRAEEKVMSHFLYDFLFHFLFRDTGEFETDLDIPNGQHEYKYLVDGAWVHDHAQPTTFNSYGTLNNIVDN